MIKIFPFYFSFIILIKFICWWYMQDEHIISSNITTSFSPNSCIIIKDFTKVDCSILFDQKANATYSPPVFNDTNIYYSSLEQAIDECPFDPLLIEFAGTLYLQNESLVFYSSRDTIIRGHSSISTPSTLVGLKSMQFLYQNNSILLENFDSDKCDVKYVPLFMWFWRKINLFFGSK